MQANSKIEEILKNKNELKKISKVFSIEEWESLRKNVDKILNYKIKEKESIEKEIEERNRKIEIYFKMMIEDGLSPEDLLSELKNTKNKEKKSKTPQKSRKKIAREFKYEYTSESGEKKLWSGLGRQPKIIKEAIDKGYTMESFLIKKRSYLAEKRT